MKGVVKGCVVREKIAQYVGVASSTEHRIMRHNIPYIGFILSIVYICTLVHYERLIIRG